MWQYSYGDCLSISINTGSFCPSCSGRQASDMVASNRGNWSYCQCYDAIDKESVRRPNNSAKLVFPLAFTFARFDSNRLFLSCFLQYGVYLNRPRTILATERQHLERKEDQGGARHVTSCYGKRRRKSSCLWNGKWQIFTWDHFPYIDEKYIFYT